MDYQVLARKWRPRGFDEVAGQSHVTTPLRNAIRSERLPPALLLTGPRGVGKTTIARILARCLNCEKGPTDEPCGTCTACTEIAEGRSTDVQEIDAASRTGVDDVREIIESVRYAPSPGKHRVYVVDEVHMLSTAAFNALLKTLEEPPPRSVFLFATTNPEKIPYTVLSRCQRHDLRRLPTAEVVARLREIAGSEGVEISDASLGAIARAGEGSLRDSLTLLDQVIAATGSPVDDDRVAGILDLIDRRVLIAIVEACVDANPAAALEACRLAGDAGIDARRLGGELLRLLRDLVVLRIAPDAEGLVEGADAELEALRAVAGRAEEARLRRMFRALLREQEDLTWAPEPFTVLEMAVVRLATLPAGEDVAQLLARLDALERRLAGGGGGGSSRPGPQATSRGGGRRSGGSMESAPAGRAAPEREEPAGDPEPTPEAPPPAGPQSRVGEPPGAPGGGPPQDAPPPAAAAGEAPLAAVFDRLLSFAMKENRGLFAGLGGGRLLDRRDGALRLELPAGIAARRLRERVAELEAVCEKFFGAPTRVEIAAPEAPTARRSERPEGTRGDDSRARRRRQEALNHPAVNAALEILEGEIVEIRPLDGPS